MHDRPLAGSFGARLMREFRAALFLPLLVILELVASYFLVPYLQEEHMWSTFWASVLAFVGWVVAALAWALYRAVRVHHLSYLVALERLRDSARGTVSVDVGFNSVTVSEFTDELCGLLVSAGWDVNGRGAWLGVDPPVRGIELVYSPDADPAPFTTLDKVLEEMGYAVTVIVENDVTRVVHGEQAKITVGEGFMR